MATRKHASPVQDYWYVPLDHARTLAAAKERAVGSARNPGGGGRARGIPVRTERRRVAQNPVLHVTDLNRFNLMLKWP